MIETPNRTEPDNSGRSPSSRWVAFGGNASNSNSVLRYSNSNNAPSNSNTNYGGGSSASINNRAKDGEATPAW